MKSLSAWYEGMTKGQKFFVYAISIALSVVYGVGLIPLAVLIYLHLGDRGRA